jgi:hypothetical protein
LLKLKALKLKTQSWNKAGSEQLLGHPPHLIILPGVGAFTLTAAHSDANVGVRER